MHDFYKLEVVNLYDVKCKNIFNECLMRLPLILFLFAGFTSNATSQVLLNDWKTIEIGGLIFEMPTQDFRSYKSDGEIKRLLSQGIEGDCLQDSITIESSDGKKIRSSITVIKSCLTQNQTDSLFLETKTRLAKMGESSSLTVLKEIHWRPDLTNFYIFNAKGYKEYLSMIIWYYKDYIIYVNLEDVSEGNEKTRYFIENIKVKN